METLKNKIKMGNYDFCLTIQNFFLQLRVYISLLLLFCKVKIARNSHNCVRIVRYVLKISHNSPNSEKKVQMVRKKGTVTFFCSLFSGGKWLP